MSETDYIQGSRASWLQMLGTCLRELGYEEYPDSVRLIMEREAAIVQLRHQIQ